MNYNDRDTLNLFYEAEEYGLPYFRDKTSVEMIKDLKDVSFDDLVLVFALSRPGLRPNVWEDYKSGLWIDEVSMPEFTQGLLARSSGLLIFQEQLMDILRSITGWSFEKANEARRIMGKKHKQQLELLYKEFVLGLRQRPFANKWVLEAGFESVKTLWNHLIHCAPYLISYKFSMNCTLHSYQVSYNLTHQ